MWSWIEKLVGRGRSPRALEFSIADPFLTNYLGMGMTLAGVPVTEATALGISAFFRAGSLVAGTIAGLPLRVLRDSEQPDGFVYRQRIRSWLDEPAGPDSYTAFEFVEIVMWHLFVHSNAYLMHRYDARGSLAGLHPIHPLYVTPRWAEERADGSPVVGGKLYCLRLPGYGSEQPISLDLDATEMTQVMGPTLDGLRGMSMLSIARESLGATIAGDRSAARMFGQGPLVAGMAVPDEELEPGETDAIRKEINSRMVGTENAGKIAVINRRMKFLPWTMSLQDAQFLQSRQFQVEEIARWTGVPPHLLMQTEKQTSWGTGVQQQELGLRRFNLVGWTSRVEGRLSRLTPRGQSVEFDFAGLERGSAADEINLLIAQIEGGLLTINEARRVRNLPPVPGGDVMRLDGTPLDAPAATIEAASANFRASSLLEERPTIHVRARRVDPAALITSGGEQR